MILDLSPRVQLNQSGSPDEEALLPLLRPSLLLLFQEIEMDHLALRQYRQAYLNLEFVKPDEVQRNEFPCECFLCGVTLHFYLKGSLICNSCGNPFTTVEVKN